MLKKVIVLICIIATLAVCVVGLVGCNEDKIGDTIKLDNTNEFEITIDNEGVINATMEEPRFFLSSGVATIDEGVVLLRLYAQNCFHMIQLIRK